MKKQQKILLASPLRIVVLMLLPVVLSLFLQFTTARLLPILVNDGVLAENAVRIQLLIFSASFFIIMYIWYRSICRYKKADSLRTHKVPIFLENSTRYKWIICLIASALMAFGMQYLAYLIEQIIYIIFPSFNTILCFPVNEVSDQQEYNLLEVLYLIILGPIGEELAFRGISLYYAQQLVPFELANFFQSLLFGLLHGNIVTGSYCFLLGMLEGYFYYCGGSIWYTIPAHILFNSISYFSFELIPASLPSNMPFSIFIGLTTVGLSIILAHKMLKFN